MKTAPKIKRIWIVTLFLAAVLSLRQQLVSQSYPSQLYSTSRLFLLRHSSDLRLFVCQRAILDDRIKRQVCLIDFIAPTNRTNWPPIQEPPVGEGKTLD